MMDERVAARQLLGVALGLGVLGDLLLRAKYITADGFEYSSMSSLGAALWAFLLCGAQIFLQRSLQTRFQGGRNAMLSFVALFGACLAWRDSNTLVTLNVLMAFAALGMVALHPRVAHVQRSSLLHYFITGIEGALAAMAGPFLLLAYANRRNAPASTEAAPEKPRKDISGAVIGAIIAVILVAIFGALFASADRAFGRLFKNIFDLSWLTDFENTTPHLFFTGLFTWCVATYFAVAFSKMRITVPESQTDNPLATSPLATTIPLIALNVLFLIFLAVQGQHLFSGDAYIRDPQGPSYSSYARRGFSELVTVATLALVVLWSGDWLDRKSPPPARRRFRVLSGIFVALVYVVMLSALHRVLLYKNAYGLTESRFYAVAFMAWIAVTLAWFAFTVLRGQRDCFIFGAIMGAMFVVFGLNVLNPDAIIVRTNFARWQQTQRMDLEYVTSLSADAVPALREVHSQLDPKTQAALDKSWGTLTSPASQDWRAWNWGRAQAD